MPQKDPVTTRLLLIIIAVLLAAVVGLLYGNRYWLPGVTPPPSALEIQRDPTGMAYICNRSGQIPIEDFLDRYTVRQGDTLLSIAKDQLNDTSRAGEIAALNKQLGLYPSLTLESSFIEVGWNLYLPFRNSPQTGGNLQVYEGQITDITPSSFSTTFNGGGGGTITFSGTTRFLFKQHDAYMVGDCVVNIEDVRSPNSAQLYVFPPDQMSQAKAAMNE